MRTLCPPNGAAGKNGKNNATLVKPVDVISQGVANLSFLAIPSWLARYGNEAPVIRTLLGAGVMMASRIMYVTLVGL